MFDSLVPKAEEREKTGIWVYKGIVAFVNVITTPLLHVGELATVAVKTDLFSGKQLFLVHRNIVTVRCVCVCVCVCVWWLTVWPSG